MRPSSAGPAPAPGNRRPGTPGAGLAGLAWRACTAGPGAAPGDRSGARPAAQLIVATAGDGRRGLEIADVVAAGPADPGDASALLLRYPGCAVAATELALGQCRLAVRRGGPVTLTVRGGCGCPLPCNAVLCGALAHAWLAAGLPPAALDETIVRPAARVPPAWWPGLGQDGVLSVSLAAADRASCRCLTWAVSGAPRPE